MVIDCCCMGGETSDDGGRKPVVGVQKRPQPSEEQERRIWKNTIKVLLLGTGESGKTTFLKQMVILHGRGEFTIDKIREYRSQIHQNIVEGMREVLAVHKKLQLSFELQASQQLAAKFNGILADGSFVRSLDMLKFCEISPTIERLWTDSSVVTAFDRRHAFQVNDSCRYFFEHIVRIAQPDYVPTNRDILYCRKATQKITDETFVIQGTPFRFFDVGGQRAQRQKWFMCFEGMITSILFMVASSEFDQRLREDRRRNRIVEALELFRTIADYQLFDKVSIILFLNKADLLREKIRQRGPDAPTFGDYFPDFTGDSHSLEAVQSYLVGKFKNVRNRNAATIFYHFTTAVDTDNIRRVFESVKHTILEKHLQSLNLT